MAAERNAALIRYIHRIASSAAVLPDHLLLKTFLDRRDEGSFAALVRRHGPRVLGVCRGVLGHHQDVEDAFQATFLVLARKAASIRNPEKLGSWLHGVAYRIATKARSKRRGSPWGPADPVASMASSPLDLLTLAEVRSIIYAELSCLPERYREPLVLCYLEGLTYDDAARCLGWSPTTLKGRLQRGRERLRRRLERRGLTLPELGTAALATQSLAVKIPAGMVEAAARTAVATPAATATSAAAILAVGVSGPLAAIQAKLALAGILALAGLGAGALNFRSPSETARAQQEPQRPAEEPRLPSDQYGDRLPDLAVTRLGTVRFNHGNNLRQLHYSPDGQRIISVGGRLVRVWDAASGKELRHFETGRARRHEKSELSEDGRTIAVLDDFEGPEAFAFSVRFFDLETGKQVREVPLPVYQSEWSVFREDVLSPGASLCALFWNDFEIQNGQPKMMHRGVRVFETRGNGKELYTIPNGDDQIRAIIFAGKERLVTADKQRNVKVLEAMTGKVIREFNHGKPVEVLAASKDGRFLATMEHHHHAIDRYLDKDLVHVWDLNTCKEIASLPAPPKSWYFRMLFSSDGMSLFAELYQEEEGYITTKWDWPKQKIVWRSKECMGTTLAASPDDSLLTVGQLQGKLEFLDAATGKRSLHVKQESARAIALSLSRSGDEVVTVGQSSVSVWDGSTGQQLRTFDTPLNDPVSPWGLHSPNGKYAVTFRRVIRGGAQGLLLWNVATGQRTDYQPSPELVANYTLSENSLLAVSSPGESKTVRVWDIAKGRELVSFQDDKAGFARTLFFAGDGELLLVVGHSAVGYHALTGKQLFAWRLESLPDEGRGRAKVAFGAPRDRSTMPGWRNLAISKDGTLAAAILAGDGTPSSPRIVLCQAKTGEIVRRWNDGGHRSLFKMESLAFSPDNRLLATSEAIPGATAVLALDGSHSGPSKSVVHLWEVATGCEIRALEGHEGEIQALAFSGDGRRLGSASLDSTVLIWDTTAASTAPLPAKEQLEKCWADLVSPDAKLAHAALWRLARSPKESVSFLAERIRPASQGFVDEIRRNIQDLDSQSFAVREKAFEKLKRAIVDAAPTLKGALDNKPSVEKRRRIESLLAELQDRPQSGEALRTGRALAVLEYAATPEARKLLEVLAGGATDAMLTMDAKACLKRLDRLNESMK